MFNLNLLSISYEDSLLTDITKICRNGNFINCNKTNFLISLFSELSDEVSINLKTANDKNKAHQSSSYNEFLNFIGILILFSNDEHFKNKPYQILNKIGYTTCGLEDDYILQLIAHSDSHLILSQILSVENEKGLDIVLQAFAKCSYFSNISVRRTWEFKHIMQKNIKKFNVLEKPQDNLSIIAFQRADRLRRLAI